MEFHFCAGCDKILYEEEKFSFKIINNLWYCLKCAAEVED